MSKSDKVVKDIRLEHRRKQKGSLGITKKFDAKTLLSYLIARVLKNGIGIAEILYSISHARFLLHKGIRHEGIGQRQS